jgi:hypothetical protein
MSADYKNTTFIWTMYNLTKPVRLKSTFPRDFQEKIYDKTNRPSWCPNLYPCDFLLFRPESFQYVAKKIFWLKFKTKRRE